jgi:hypothetical protein
MMYLPFIVWVVFMFAVPMGLALLVNRSTDRRQKQQLAEFDEHRRCSGLLTLKERIAHDYYNNHQLFFRFSTGTQGALLNSADHIST